MSENKIGQNAFRWKGGVYHQNNKYIHLKQEDGTYKQEHRIIMEKYLGRELDSDEIVHHIDGDGKNNKLENLKLMNRESHARLHTTERWEQGIFYGD